MAQIREIVFECRRPAALARFWAGAIDSYFVPPYDADEVENLSRLGIDDPDDDPVVTVESDDEELRFWFEQRETHGPGQLRLGLISDDVDHEIARLVDLGATVLWDQPDPNVVAMHDPEGNAFSLMQVGEVGATTARENVLPPLVTRLAAAGAPDPPASAALELDEDKPELARYLFLSAVRKDAVDYWTGATVGELPLIAALVERGISVNNLAALVRQVATDAVEVVLEKLDDGADRNQEAGAPGWAIIETAGEHLPASGLFERRDHTTGRELSALVDRWGQLTR